VIFMGLLRRSCGGALVDLIMRPLSVPAQPGCVGRVDRFGLTG
jgi:hypothetical protein